MIIGALKLMLIGMLFVFLFLLLLVFIIQLVSHLFQNYAKEEERKLLAKKKNSSLKSVTIPVAAIMSAIAQYQDQK